MRIFLAPMEGVVDHTMRSMLTRIGGFDRCVTEFVRINQGQLLPPRVFYRLCPELLQGGKTPSGTPVYVQLLGGNPEAMAMNAERAASLGAPGIDINFGCPAKTVNKSDGGAIILREPERIFSIVHAVRKAVPISTPVTVKIRLGYEDSSLLADNCAAIYAAGATELAIHARTKLDSYKPPAHWQQLNAIQASAPIPIIANGEIWQFEDYQQCRQDSGCKDIMLGRGALSRPGLARQIRSFGKDTDRVDWLKILYLLESFAQLTEDVYEAKYVNGRVKQWLAYLRDGYCEANMLFEKIKRLTRPEDIAAIIRQAQASHQSLAQEIH